MNALVPVTAPASDMLARELRYTAAELGVTRARQYRDNRRRLDRLLRSYQTPPDPWYLRAWTRAYVLWYVMREVVRSCG